MSYIDELTKLFKLASSKMKISGDVLGSLEKMKDSMYEIDSAMTKLSKTTDLSSSKYTSFLDKTNKKAKELGVTIITEEEFIREYNIENPSEL